MNKKLTATKKKLPKQISYYNQNISYFLLLKFTITYTTAEILCLILKRNFYMLNDSNRKTKSLSSKRFLKKIATNNWIIMINVCVYK